MKHGTPSQANRGPKIRAGHHQVVRAVSILSLGRLMNLRSATNHAIGCDQEQSSEWCQVTRVWDWRVDAPMKQELSTEITQIS